MKLDDPGPQNNRGTYGPQDGFRRRRWVYDCNGALGSSLFDENRTSVAIRRELLEPNLIVDTEGRRNSLHGHETFARDSG